MFRSVLGKGNRDELCGENEAERSQVACSCWLIRHAFTDIGSNLDAKIPHPVPLPCVFLYLFRSGWSSLVMVVAKGEVTALMYI